MAEALVDAGHTNEAGRFVERRELVTTTVACVQSRDEQVRSAVHDFLAAQEIGQVAGLLEQAALARVGQVAEVNGLTVHDLAEATGLSDPATARVLQFQPASSQDQWGIPALLDDLADLVRLMAHTQHQDGTRLGVDRS